MIKLFSAKEKQRVLSNTGDENGGSNKSGKLTPGELRLQKDISELNLAKTMSIKYDILSRTHVQHDKPFLVRCAARCRALDTHGATTHTSAL